MAKEGEMEVSYRGCYFSKKSEVESGGRQEAKITETNVLRVIFESLIRSDDLIDGVQPSSNSLNYAVPSHLYLREEKSIEADPVLPCGQASSNDVYRDVA
ncbi:hypothetical protein I204_00120 [Kwoniella mangroviensis CBS 8886]|nr:hypothetical protein I204_00120 [Kwoniella mangroviensis CBS 8886]